MYMYIAGICQTALKCASQILRFLFAQEQIEGFLSEDNSHSLLGQLQSMSRHSRPPLKYLPLPTINYTTVDVCLLSDCLPVLHGSLECLCRQVYLSAFVTPQVPVPQVNAHEPSTVYRMLKLFRTINFRVE